MAKMPKDIKVTVTPVVDTSALDQLKAQVQAVSEGFAQVGQQMKASFDALGEGLTKAWNQNMPSVPVITPEQICAAYEVPPEMIGLLPPDAGVSLQQGLEAGTVTSEIYGWDGSVLDLDECPANTSPFVSGQLGINAMFVNQQPTGWQTKDTDEILADIQATADLYLGKIPMPHKSFAAKEPNPDSPTAGIPAHAVFTSPLIHAGNPTGEWKDVGAAMDFVIAHATPEMFDAQAVYQQKYTEMVLKAAAQAEKEMLGSYLGVDVSKASGNTVTVQASPADPGVVQVSVYGPDGEPVTQTTVPLAKIEEIAQATEKMITIDPIQTGTPWYGEGWGHQHQELGHTKAFAEALDQHEKVTKLQAKVFNVLGKDQPVVVTGPPKVSTTHKLPHGATLIEYPDGVSTLDLPGTVAVPGKGVGALHGTFTFPTEEARQIAGLDPKKPGVSLPSTTQWLYGKPYVWNPEEGWVSAAWKAKTSKLSDHASGAVLEVNGSWPAPSGTDHMHFEVDGPPMHQSFPQVSVQKGGVKFPKPVSTGLCGCGCDTPVEQHDELCPPGKHDLSAHLPDTWYDEAGQPIEEPLFEPVPEPPIHPLAHLWCTACDVHWMAHKGDPVACDSGGYLRPSTPLEDKQYVDRLAMLEAAGLK
jgi:hypothetical protein